MLPSVATTGRACRGSTPRTGNPDYWDGDIPWLTPDDLSTHQGVLVSRGRRSITEAGFASTSTHMLPKNSILFSSRAPIGYTAVAANPLCTNQGFKSLIPPAGVKARYVYWYLRHATPTIRELGSGTTFRELSKKRMNAVPFVLAPTAEQKRIVAAIEEHFSRLDAVEHDITKARGNGATLPSVVLPGLFSRDWPTRRIRELARVGSGATPKRSDVRYWSGGTIPWVTSGAINDRMISSASGHITEEALAGTSVRLWPVGTVLVAMYGEGKTRGKAALLQIESTCNQACAAIDYDRSLVIGDYLLTYLNSQYEASRRLASGGVQPNLSLGLIKDMEIPVPSLEIQRSVALQAEDIVLGSEQFAATCTKARQHVTALRRSILAAAFSGQLVPQDPQDEPASVLMERIAASRSTKPNRRASAGQVS